MSIALIALVVARAAQFGALTLAFGGALYPFYAPPAFQGGAARTILIAASILAVFSAAGWACALVFGMTGEASALTDPQVWSAFFFATSFGRFWLLRIGFSAALAVAAIMLRNRLVARNWPTAAIAGLAAALLVAQAWIGHVATVPEPWRWIAGLGYAAHVLGAGAWFGGLVPLGLMVSQARSNNQGRDVEQALRRFSAMALVAVAAILAGGLVVTASRAHSASGLIASEWGRVLFVKAAGFSAILLVAAVNRFGLTPRAAEADAIILRRLGRNIAIEQIGGLVLLGAAAILGALPPPG